jgi:hypothetical protein
MRNRKATDCPKPFRPSGGLALLEHQLLPLQLEYAICGDLQSPHETIFSIIGQLWRHPNVSVANGGEELLFHEFFILSVCLELQLSKNVAFPRAIAVDPNILLHDS